MTRQLSRYGEGKLGCIIWLLVLGAVVLVAAKLIPVRIRSAELYEQNTFYKTIYDHQITEGGEK